MKFLACLLLVLPLAAFAWEPTKTITAIVPFAPGSGNEMAFRLLAKEVEKNNPKVKFIVEHHPGADSVTGMNYFVSLPSDGYSVAVPSHMNIFVTSDIWQKDIKKFEYTSFTEIMTMGKSPLLLVANIKSTINTPKEFEDYVRTTLKPVNIAIAGGGHKLAYEYLMHKTRGNSQVKSIRFQGPAQAAVSTAAGDTEFALFHLAIAKPFLDAGKIKIIGITGNKKLPLLPNVPLLQAIAPGINVFASWAMVLPPNTPKEIAEWYQKNFTTAIYSADYQRWAAQNSIIIDKKELTPAGLRKQIQELRTTFMPLGIDLQLGE